MPGGDSTGHWYGLLGIYEHGAQEQALWNTQHPIACPYDGEPLRPGPNGEWYCPFAGDYEYPRDGIIQPGPAPD